MGSEGEKVKIQSKALGDDIRLKILLNGLQKNVTQMVGPYDIQEVFMENGTYSLINLDGTDYPNWINHDKLKKSYVDILD